MLTPPSATFRTIVALLLSLLFFTCFAMSEQLIDGLSSAKMFYFYGVSILVILVMAVAALFNNRSTLISFNWLDASIVGFWIYNCFRLSVTSYVTFDNKRFLVLTLLTLLYFIFKWIAKGRSEGNGWNKELKILLSIFMLGGLLQSIFCILQLYNLNPWYSSGYFKIVGTFGNPDAVAGYLGVVIPSAFGIWQLTPKQEVQLRLIRHLAIITFFVGLFVLPATLIRGSWLAVAIGVGFVIFYKYNLGDKLKSAFNLRWKVLMGTVVSGLVFSLLMIGLYNFKPDSAFGRILIWKVSSRMILEYPVLGIGYDQFAVEYNNYQAKYFSSHKRSQREEWVAGNVRQAHNEFLQTAAELGVLGCIFFGLVIWKIFDTRHPNKVLSPLLLADRTIIICRSGILSYFIVSCFSFPSHILPTSISFYFLISLLSAFLKNATVRLANKTLIVYKGIFTCILIFNILFIFAWRAKMHAYSIWQEAQLVGLNGGHVEAVRLFSEVEKVIPNEGRFLFSYGAMLIKTNDYERGLNILVRASQRFNDPKLWIVLAECHRAMGNRTLWEKSLQHSINMVPTYFYPRYLLAKAFFEEGSRSKAKKIARQILEMEVKVDSGAIRQMRKEMKYIVAS